MTEAVQAAVEGTAYSFDALFTYLVPEELCGRISAGMRARPIRSSVTIRLATLHFSSRPGDWEISTVPGS